MTTISHRDARSAAGTQRWQTAAGLSGLLELASLGRLWYCFWASSRSSHSRCIVKGASLMKAASSACRRACSSGKVSLSGRGAGGPTCSHHRVHLCSSLAHCTLQTAKPLMQQKGPACLLDGHECRLMHVLARHRLQSCMSQLLPKSWSTS